MKFTLHNRFTEQLNPDKITKNYPREVANAHYSYVRPSPAPNPTLISYSQSMANTLGLPEQECHSAHFLSVFSGQKILTNSAPYSMNYGGHQFGHWAEQLGDGRAINLAEVVTPQNGTLALQLKGAGPTPYSRNGDGWAVLRSSIREYLCSEAMHHLGIPTTRALSLISTGQNILRDKLYDGNAAHEPGAVVCRVAPSFIRFGHFEIFAQRQQTKALQQLLDFTITHYFSDLDAQYKKDKGALYCAWFDTVCQSTAQLMVHWARVGFVHGVMNTDNLSILGLTLDYGPYGWLDDFNPQWTPNTTDAQQSRYRFEQQSQVALWNLYQLANAISSLVPDTHALEQSLRNYQKAYQTQWQQMMANKLGLEKLHKEDASLFSQLETVLARTETDMTLFYRLLGSQEHPDITDIHEAFYLDGASNHDGFSKAMSQWFIRYNIRLQDNQKPFAYRQKIMNNTNPCYVLRNYLTQQAIEKAESGDMSEVQNLLSLIQDPYTEKKQYQHYAKKRPFWARDKFGCSTLSCSS